MKVLIIDSNIDADCWGSKDLCRFVRQTGAATVYVRRAPQGDLPESPKGFDRIIASGSKTSCFDSSPWVERLISFVEQTIQLGIPYLGVCFGHQILARTLGGREILGKSAPPELGPTEIQVMGESPLFRGLPRNFISCSSHYEEVRKAPPGVRVFAKSKTCSIQAFQLVDQPVYGIQFHPEKASEASQVKVSETLFSNFIGNEL